MTFPTTGILDNFNRADENPLDNGTWSDRNVNSDLLTETNLVRGATVGAQSSRYWSAAQFGPDCEVYCTVNHTPNTAADYMRLFARLQNPGAAGEVGYMMQWSNDANGCRIFKETARETFSVLAQAAAARYTDADVVGLELIGTAITVYKNGVSVLTTTDGTTTAAGYLALAGRGTSFRWDDFGGGTIVPASTFVPRVLVF